MIPTRSPDIADVIVTVLILPSGDRGRRLGTAATCDSARGGLLLLDTGPWDPGNVAPGDIQSRAPHPLHLHPGKYSAPWHSPLSTFIRLLLSIYCIVSRIRLDPSQMSVWRPCITATHITSSSSCQQFYHNLQQQQQQDAAGIKTSKLLSNCQLYCQLCIQFLSFP